MTAINEISPQDLRSRELSEKERMTQETATERLARVSAAAYRIRHHALTMGEVQGQGYVGQALGAADMLAAVYSDQLRFRAEDPEWEERDRFLLSTGHYAIGHYAALAEAGVVPVEELETYGSDDSRLPMSGIDRKSTRLNSSHLVNSYAVFCLKKKNATAIGSNFKLL